MPISRRGRSCHFLSLGSAGISPSTGPDGTTKLIFGLAVRGSISSNFEKGSPSFSRSHTEFTKLEMCHRSSTVVLSANEGIGVPFTPVDMVLKIVSILYGSSLLPLKFQHLCQSAGWIGNRSEEHTSELQSLAYLVCRLLLEKKKHNPRPDTTSTTYT